MVRALTMKLRMKTAFAWFFHGLVNNPGDVCMASILSRFNKPAALGTSVGLLLALAASALALRSGLTFDRIAALAQGVDTEVIVLFVPACALMFAITAQVLSIILCGGMPDSPAPASRPIRAWQVHE